MPVPDAELQPSADRLERRPGWRRVLPGWRVRIFASDVNAPRSRRPTDALVLALAVLALAAMVVPAPGPTDLDQAVAELLGLLPGLLGWFWEVCYALLLLWALLLIALAAGSRGRRVLLRDQLATAVVALAAAVGTGLLSGVPWDDLGNALVHLDGGTAYPAIPLAGATAVALVSSPYVSLPLRRTGQVLVVLGALAAIALGYAIPLAVVGGLLVAVVAAAAVHLALGSPGGLPPLSLVAAELADMGIEVQGLRSAPVDPRGVAVVTGELADGRPVLVKVFGRDAREGLLLASWWARLLYRDQAPVTRGGRQREVEHEAFVTLLAERAGVPVLAVLGAGVAWGRDSLLVRVDGSRALADVPDAQVSAGLVDRFWAALATLHGARLAHGGLTLRSLVVRADGAAALTDLSAAQTGPDEVPLLADQAQLLVCTALKAGPEAAVAAAARALGPERLNAVVPYLQPAALDRDTRKRLRAASWKLAELREAVVASSGLPAPKLEKLRRVSWTSVAMMAVLLMVAYAVISAVAGVGIDNLVAEFAGAHWGWVVAALLISPVIQVGQAVAMMGASIRRVRFLPSLLLQYAIQFVGLAVPSSAGKIALEIRYFQLVGTNPTGAVTIALIDSIAGLVIQILVIVLTLFTGLVTLSVSNSSPMLGGVDWARVGILVGALLVLAVLLVALIPKVRRFVRARTADSLAGLSVLRSPRKAATILVGSLAWNVVSAIVLGCSLRAFGGEATFAELILVNTLVALFAGLMPIPGNIGVSEAALTAGLVALGVPQTAALSAAIVYRMATFYLPPIWGFASMRYLRRHSYL